jgi:hypothetical protein
MSARQQAQDEAVRRLAADLARREAQRAAVERWLTQLAEAHCAAPSLHNSSALL